MTQRSMYIHKTFGVLGIKQGMPLGEMHHTREADGRLIEEKESVRCDWGMRALRYQEDQAADTNHLQPTLYTILYILHDRLC
jgi:hypothetical protein